MQNKKKRKPINIPTRIRKQKFFRREIILTKLAELGEATMEPLFNCLTSPFISLMDSLNIFDNQWKKSKNMFRYKIFSFDFKNRAHLASLIYKLKKEGLVSGKSKGKYKITVLGNQYLTKKNKKPSFAKIYINKNPVESSEPLLVIFDIPEDYKTKRDWLRLQLTVLGFLRLQNSVWIGKNVLPKEFIKDLANYNLSEYVHILTIKKEGTISKVLDDLYK